MGIIGQKVFVVKSDMSAMYPALYNAGYMYWGLTVKEGFQYIDLEIFHRIF